MERPLGLPDVVVVGSAARDVDRHDPRGWRLGGGVTYGALACARLGIRTGAVIGVDGLAATASELDLLRAAGAEVVTVPLAAAPVFHNLERPSGRVQTCLDPGAPLPVDALPPAWRSAPAWILAPVAGELPDTWADVPAATACVAFGWQGVLRRLVADERVTRKAPGPSSLLARADIVGVSRNDVDGHVSLAAIGAWLRPTAEVLVTAGPYGGLLLTRDASGRLRGRWFPPVPARVELDPTGAGDVTLAALLCARIAGGPQTRIRGRDLRLAATIGSLIVEGPGLGAVPTLAAARERLLA